jgi:hypothetical protein
MMRKMHEIQGFAAKCRVEWEDLRAKIVTKKPTEVGFFAAA